MRYPVLIAMVSLAGSAAAQPADPPTLVEAHPCTVTIVRAPDDVRREIEDWVHREVSCRISLDVRVIPTDGGLYLLARESTGKLHERLVPDGQAAGVLVASWVANDSLEPLPPPPPLAPVPVLIPAAPFVVPPGELMLRGAPGPCTTLACRGPRRSASWGLGVTVLPTDNSGARVRLDFDVVRNGGFAAGLVLAGSSATGDSMSYYYYYDGPYGTRSHRVDGRALGGISWTMYHGAWSARVQAAVGAVWSHIFKDEDQGVYARNWAGLAFEASILLGYHVSDQWSVGVAPVATAYRASAWRNDFEASLGWGDFGVLLELRKGQ